MNSRIYLDHNATTPIHSGILEQVPGWLESWGNASSIHSDGRGPKTLLRESRANFARLIGADPLEVVFTSGGSEANNLALKGLCGSGPKGTRNQILISSVEHPSVTKTAEALRELGFVVQKINVDRNGQFDMDQLKSLLSVKTLLVSVMLANNETGHILPIREIADRAHEVGAKVHCDAVQALGKIQVNVRELGVDLASFSGHKFYALKGCGALYVRRGVNLNSLIHGGGQERGRRAGTENLLAIASLGWMAKNSWMEQSARLTVLRDQMEKMILEEIPGVQVTGKLGLRLPTTSSLVIDDVDGETLLINLDVQGFSVSTGAACSSGNPEPSPTLLAMGLTRVEAQSSLRLSLGWGTTLEDIEKLVLNLKLIVLRLRKFKTERYHLASEASL